MALRGYLSCLNKPPAVTDTPTHPHPAQPQPQKISSNSPGPRNVKSMQKCGDFELILGVEAGVGVGRDDEDADVATQLASEAKALFAKADLEVCKLPHEMKHTAQLFSQELYTPNRNYS
eukprot:2560202-Amphidinium_carterae.1